uniref:Uncharacterized protein n=1 Tax=Trypanosoma vivax (strain Y486) TaxID=1055687 RepID=G0TTY0_TRYVY|nr:conserved hypothetical protein [Trypanosoma vivax Y486]
MLIVTRTHGCVCAVIIPKSSYRYCFRHLPTVQVLVLFSRDHLHRVSLLVQPEQCEMKQPSRIPLGSALAHRWRKHFRSEETLPRCVVASLLKQTIAEASLTRCEGRKSILASRNHSLAVWSTLNRHYVNWRNCIALLKAQLAWLRPPQRDFVRCTLKAAPQSWTQLLLLMTYAWHLGDDLLSVSARLMAAETIVQFATLVQIAVSERPQLNGVLPVSSQALMHCYEIGRISPEVALNCCLTLALANPEKVSRLVKERLAFGYSMLYVARGHWSTALSFLSTSRDVRPSAKRLFALHTARLTQWEKAARNLKPMNPQFVVSAITYAPHWLFALRAYEAWRSSEASHALLSRRDFLLAAGWEVSLGLCSSNRVRSYAVLRPILDMIPREHPRRLQLYTDAIQATEKMYPGTLTRRAFRLVRSGCWSEAIGLLSGCRYYDVALPLVPYTQSTALPHQLLAYEEAVHRVKMSAGPFVAFSSQERLAVALHGDWNELKVGDDDARLNSLLLSRITASCRNVRHAECGDVQCFTFQSREVTRAVCRAASRKVRKYFAHVIPPELREHHFGTEKFDVPEPVSSGRYTAFLHNDIVINNEGECNVLCAMVVEHLRVSGNLTEQAFLREIAHCLAAGRVQLPDTLHHELPLAVLQAATHFHRLNASATVRIALKTPSHLLLTCSSALEKSIDALVLTKRWERAIVLLQQARQPYPEASANLAYAAPRAEATKILKALWRCNPQNHWALLLLDLLSGDVRLVVDELRMCFTRMKFGGCSKETYRRRRLFGACCALLQSSQSMCAIVRATNTSLFCALDVDEHGLQRLIDALTWEKALIAISDISENNEVVDELWLLAFCAKPRVPLHAICKVAMLFRYNAVLHSVFVCYLSVEQNDLAAAVKAIARYQALVLAEYGRNSVSMRLLVLLMRNTLQHFDNEIWAKSSLWGLTRHMFNCVVEQLGMADLGRAGRKCIPAALGGDRPFSCLLVFGFLYQKLSRIAQVPIPARVTSRLLQCAAVEANDYRAAFYFFKSLAKPSDRERSLLVFAMRDVEDAMTLLVSSGKFVHSRPDQVILWSDPYLGEKRWCVALELLAQSSLPYDQLASLCSKWTWGEALRALELLRRTQDSSPEAQTCAAILLCSMGVGSAPS